LLNGNLFSAKAKNSGWQIALISLVPFFIKEERTEKNDF
jgi:hypothetical protein